MAYSGSTAASSVANPPVKLVDSVGGNAALWAYRSTHTSTDTKTANFFTDAKDLGVAAGDWLLQSNTGTTIAYFGIFGAVTTSGAALASAVSSTAA